MAKCGACEPSDYPPFGSCTKPSVDVDKELAIVNDLSKEELLDLAAEVMDEYMYKDEESSSDEEFALRSSFGVFRTQHCPVMVVQKQWHENVATMGYDSR